MYLSQLFQRDGSQCSPGDTYYVCASNGFTGCCSASNVCELAGCPDGNPNAPTTTITLSTEGSAPKATAASSAKTSSPAVTTPAAMIGNVAMAGSGTASSVLGSPTASQSSISNRDTKTNNAPIIAGVVCSIVAVSILSVLVWFILKRRQQKSQRITSSSTFGELGKEYDLNRRSTDEEQAEQQTRGGETYGSYKGYQPAPLTGTARKFSNTSVAIEESNQEDEPIPDPEKTGLEGPPDSEHPAYHPLPGQSPEIPTYSTYSATPATPTTPITPIHSQQQRQHPAYHAFQLSQHPAFRSPRPREPASAVRSKPSNLQQEVTPPLEGFSFVTKVRNSIQNLRPSSRSNPNLRSELPGDMPRTLLLSSAKSDPSLLSRFNTNNNNSDRNSQHSSHFQKGHRNAKRGEASKTGVSTYSIPIGLGVDSPATPGLNSPGLDSPITPGPLSPAPVMGTAYKLPIQKFISNANRKPVGGPKLVSSKPPTPEMPFAPEMPAPPMKANMNEREDHVMSWASYSAGNLSGIGPSSSNGSAKSRKQRQREIELGVASKPKKDYSQRRPKPAELQGDVPVGENGTPPMNIEHEIMRWSELRGPQRPGSRAFSEVPETPLSQVYRESWVERESWARR